MSEGGAAVPAHGAAGSERGPDRVHPLVHPDIQAPLQSRQDRELHRQLARVHCEQEPDVSQVEAKKAI
ncbi:hypothetical protein MEX01_50970 [Methylorubrum extorquens]|nr:hypothetical protein MEX01_50970 [Methylorubrum extorquens]